MLEVTGRGLDVPPTIVVARSHAPRRALDGERVALAVHWLTLVVGFLILMSIDSQQWFFFDEWAFLVHGLNGQPLQLLEPHNEHWSTVPIIVYHFLYQLVGLREYWPYLAALMTLHVGVCHLLWRIMGRCGVSAWLRTGAVLVLLFLGAGYENLIWAFQIGFVGSVFFGLMQILIVDAAPRRLWRSSAGTLAAVAGLMCSGIGVPMVLVAGITALLRRGVIAAVETVGPPAVVFILWFFAYGKHGIGGVPFRLGDMLHLSDYVWTGLVYTADHGTGLIGAGGALILLLGWRLIVRSDSARAYAPAFAMALGVVLLFLILGVGRLSLGVNEAASGRYAYVAATLLLPSVTLCLQEFVQQKKLRWVAVMTLIGVCSLHGLGELRDKAQEWGKIKVSSRTQILNAANHIAGQPPNAQPEASWAPDLTYATLEALRNDGALPRLEKK